MKNLGDNDFGINDASSEATTLIPTFLDNNDFGKNTRRAFEADLKLFASWFSVNNREPFSIARTTSRDVSDFRDHLRRDKQQAIATVNRRLVSVRRFFGWLVDEGMLGTNPAKKVKELKTQALAPKGLERAQVRKLLREVELRNDLRANAIFHLFLYTGARVGDLVGLEISDMTLGDRSGQLVCQNGKGMKQRTVPLPNAARKALLVYLETRPQSDRASVFIGERGPLTERGIRNLCDKYSAICGFNIYPHLLRHTMAHQYLANTNNDLVGLAQILGHENLNTTSRYTLRKQDDLNTAAEKLEY